MAERPSVWAGLLVAFLGFLPIAWLMTRASDPGPRPVVTQPAEQPVEPRSTTSPAVHGLDASVSRVLSAAGNVQVVGASDVPGVAPEVVRVLVSFDVPLLVPVEGTP